MPTAVVTRRQPVEAPTSLDVATRTVEVVAATETPVRRMGWEGEYDEVLVCAPAAVDLARFIGGPLLLDHRFRDSRAVIGTVVAARAEGGQLLATVRFSAEQPGEDAWRKVREGTFRAVSIGTMVETVETTERPGAIPLRRVTRWTPFEVSIVPVPADPASQFRSLDGPSEGTTMTTEPENPAAEPGETFTRSAADIRQFQRIGAAAGLEQREIDDALVDPKVTLDGWRARALDAMATRAEAAPTRSGIDPFAGAGGRTRGFQDAAVAALANRLNPAVDLPADARELRGRSMVELAADCLRRAGITVMSRNNPDEVLRRAFNSGGGFGGRALHTTSDFPYLLSAAANKAILAAYEPARGIVRTLSRTVQVPDFKTVTKLRIGEAPALLKVNEHGEVTSGTRGESREAYSLATYARIFGLTRQAIINDDLNAFGDWTVAMGRAAAELESERFIFRLSENGGDGQTMDDGNPLFHTSHGNLAAVATGINETSLGAARQALRQMTGINGSSPINVVPKYLVVGPALETAADKMVAAITPTTTGEVNPFAGKLSVLVEPRISGNGWYLFADTASLPTFELAQLQSAPGPQVATRDGWDVLGTEFRVVYDLEVAAIDYRGAYRNAGG